MKEQSICVQTELVTKVSSCDQINMPLSRKQSRFVEMIVTEGMCLDRALDSLFVAYLVRKMWPMYVA